MERVTITTRTGGSTIAMKSDYICAPEPEPAATAPLDPTERQPEPCLKEDEPYDR